MNRFDWYFGQYVSQAEMDEAFWWAEVADHGISVDSGLVGILDAFGVTEHAPTPDLTVDIGGPGAAYDRTGQRCALADVVTVVDCSVDEYGVATAVTTPGWERWLGVFLRFKRLYSDPKVDRNGVTVYTHQTEGVEIVVRQGTQAVAGAAARVGLLSNALLLADVLLPFGATQILNGEPPAGSISLTRREDWVRQSFAPPYVIASFAAGTAGSAVSALLAYLNEHISDLGLFHSSGALAHTWASTWFGAEAMTSASVGGALNEIVADLAQAFLRTDPPGATGAARIGTHGYRTGAAHVQWGDLAVASVQTALQAVADAVDAHVAGGVPRHTAGAIDSTAYSWISSTNVQAAIQEIVDDLASQVLGATGGSRVGLDAMAGTPESLGAGTVRAAISSLLAHINARGRLGSDEACYGDWWFSGENALKTFTGGGAPPGATPGAISAKAFWGAGGAWGVPTNPINTCDLSAYLGATGIFDLCVGHLYGGTTRVGKPYLYALTNGPGAAPQCSVLVIDPDTMARVATWPLAALGFAGHAAGNFAAVSFCTDGTRLFILFKDGVAGDFVGAISAIDGTIQWGGAVFSLGGFRLSGSYPEDRIIVANAITDLVVLCGGVVAGATGLLYSCDKNGVARWGGLGRDGDAVLGHGSSGLCSDGTNVFFVTDAAGVYRLSAATIAAGANPGLATPLGLNDAVMDLVYDGVDVRWGTSGSAARAAIQRYDSGLDALATEMVLTNIAAPPPFFYPNFGSACLDGEGLCILEYDSTAGFPYERLRVIGGGDHGDPWKNGIGYAEVRGPVHALNPVGSAPGTIFFGVGRVCWDGRNVYAVVNSGAAVLDLIRKVPRTNYRG